MEETALSGQQDQTLLDAVTHSTYHTATNRFQVNDDRLMLVVNIVSHTQPPTRLWQQTEPSVGKIL